MAEKNEEHSMAKRWWHDYGFEPEVQKALELEDRRHDRRHELTGEDLDWLTTYKRTHDHPGHGYDECDFPMWQCHAFDVNIAGGWGFKIGLALDVRGWDLGWIATLSGLEAFTEAFGVTAPDGAGDTLGPFGSYEGAADALQVALLSALVLVSERAIAHSPAAQDVQDQQKKSLAMRRKPN